MAQSFSPYDDYLVLSTSATNGRFENAIDQQYNSSYYQTSLSYQLDTETDWMSNASSPSMTYSTPDYSPISTSLAALHKDLPPHWTTAQINTQPSDSTKDLQKLIRRRQQNRESQRAFRQRKNKDLEHLEQALSELQAKHEKLLKCFVGITTKVSAERLGGMVDDMEFLDEQIRQYNTCLGSDVELKMKGERRERIRGDRERS